MKTVFSYLLLGVFAAAFVMLCISALPPAAAQPLPTATPGNLIVNKVNSVCAQIASEYSISDKKCVDTLGIYTQNYSSWMNDNGSDQNPSQLVRAAFDVTSQLPEANGYRGAGIFKAVTAMLRSQK